VYGTEKGNEQVFVFFIAKDEFEHKVNFW